MKRNIYKIDICRVRVYLITVFLFIYTVFCFSEEFRFEHLTTEEGLAGNSVSSIIQDSRGFLWFGTQDGLNRYDGKEFILYEHLPFRKDSLQHNLIQTMYYDRESDLIWIGTYGGLSAFSPENGNIRHYPLSEDFQSRKRFSRVIVSIEKDKNGLMWIGTLSGLISLDPETGKIEEFSNIKGDDFSLPDNSVRDIVADEDGKIWVATYGGLAFFRSGKFEKIHRTEHEEKFPSCYIMDIEKLQDGKILVASWDGGISLFDEKNRTLKTVKLPDNRFYFIKTDSKGQIWAGTWGGGIYFAESTDALFSSEYKHIAADNSNRYSVSNNIGYSFLEDSSGLIWIGTNGGGINKLNPDIKDYRFIYSSSGNADSLPDERIKDLYIDEKGNFWLGTYSSGIYLYDVKGKFISRFSNDKNNTHSLNNNFINEIMSDSSRNIWIATNDGFCRYLPEKSSFERFYIENEKILMGVKPGQEHSPDIIYALFEDSRGRLWIGSYLDGVYIWDRKTGESVHLHPDSDDERKISDQMVFDIAEDKYGNVWIGTNFGLNRYDMETGKITMYLYDPGHREGISNNVIVEMFLDSAGDFWIGTSGGGLCRYDYTRNVFFHITKEDGLGSNNVTGISEDRRGNIIVSTHKGLSEVNRISYDICTLTGRFGLYDYELKGDIITDNEGNLYISSKGVVFKIDNREQCSHLYDPEVVISSFKLYDEDYIFEEGSDVFDPGLIYLPWNKNSFSFKFVSLDYSSPLNNRYEYILEGFDKDWIHSGNRNYAVYTNISPGKYTFRARGTNSSGLWSRNEPSIDLVISTPPYKSIFAYSLYAAAVLVIFYSLIMIIKGNESVKRLKQEKKLKEELVEVNNELDRLVRIDPLTGVFNRHHFSEALDNVWHLHKRLDVTVSLLMADIDFFKNYNDTYGHVAGDDCLKKFSCILGESVTRKTDSVFRYGGEEFIIILFDTGIEGASVVAEKIREKLLSEKIKHSASSVSEYVTVSIGLVSTENSEYESAEKMVIDADRKLYSAKEHGRNTVIC